MNTIVPNAPCGVESQKAIGKAKTDGMVPNAPCGVERKEYSNIEKKKA